MLTGSNLSIVQVRAGEYLLLIDARDKTTDFAERFRMGLATSHPQLVDDLYPEWKKRREAADAAKDSDVEAQKQIEWSVPASEEEEAELLAWVASRMSGQMTSGELGEGGWM